MSHYTRKMKLKVKVSNVTPEDLERTRQIQINKARAVFQSKPFVTRLYIAMKTGLDISFIKKNWEQIIN